MTVTTARPATWYLGRRLSLVQQAVESAVARRRAVDPEPDDRFRGLYVSDTHVDRMLATTLGASDAPTSVLDVDGMELEDEADRFELAGGPSSRLRTLARTFGLDGTDTQLLLVAMAPDLDPRFERLYGYLNDDVTSRRATIALALELTGLPPWSGRDRARLSDTGPLVAGGLIGIGDPDRPFLTRPLTAPDRVVAHLLGGDGPEQEIARLMIHAVGVASDADPALCTALRGGSSLLYVRETVGGEGLSRVADALRCVGRESLTLDASRVDATDGPELARRAIREARLRDAVLVVGPVEALAAPGPSGVQAWAESDAPVVLLGSGSWDPAWSTTVPVVLDATPLTPSDRDLAWRRALTAHADGTTVDPVDATRQFRLSPERVARAARYASQQADAHGRDISVADLYEGARSQNAAGLERLARRVPATFGWDQLVLPATVRAQLAELLGQVRYRAVVYESWGMASASTKGIGVKALFAGDSGTGKTVSAEAIAGELGLDLYVIDLASVVDKYVGETEKNLDRIFAEADRVNGVLLFDEADALFGKRSEVKDAHDRYANVEVAYLLQRMEQFDGLAILTSNLRSNLDDAFARRLDAIVDFPMPDDELRLHLWQLHLGAGAPRASDIDLAFLASAFELSGGNIRNVCVTAAFRAAGEDRAISMRDLIRGTVREYRKLGRLLVADEFGAYHEVAGATP